MESKKAVSEITKRCEEDREMANHVEYSTISSPIGPLLIASTEKGLCLIEFGSDELAVLSLSRWVSKHLLGSAPVQKDERNRKVITQLEEYFSGKRKVFDCPLDLYGTPFQKKVWLELSKIPYGETRSYKQIALGIGASKAVRAIGGANNRNPIPIIIPCHRVIGSNGELVGYGGGLPIKEHLLHLEGVLGNHASAKAIR